MSQKFDKQISVEDAYRLICLQNADKGGRDAVSARGWIENSSWYDDSRMTLVDGSYITRDFCGDLYHSNMTTADVMAGFGIEV